MIHQNITFIITNSLYSPKHFQASWPGFVFPVFALQKPDMNQYNLYYLNVYKAHKIVGLDCESGGAVFSFRIWDTSLQSSAVETLEHHTEFVCGLDFNLHIPGQVMDSWHSLPVYSSYVCF